MLANLAKALAYVDQDEGPELNVSPSEPGGSSKHGVSMTVLQEWHKQKGLPPPTMDDMRAVDAVLAGQIYTERFATPIRFNDLPKGVDYRLLDIAINLGVTGGATALQVALAVWPMTGRVDDATLTAAIRIEPRAAILALGAAWLAKKRESGGWAVYGHGWTNRCIRANARALNI